MAKAPVAGRVKTRLCPPCTPPEAAALAEAALADTLDAVGRSGADRKVVALDGEPGPWLPTGFEVMPQRGGAFDQRLAGAWSDLGASWGVQIGMDTPQVTPEVLDCGLDALAGGASRRAVLGLAMDGGWWMIGLRDADPRSVFGGVPMSTEGTGRAQAARLRSLGFEVLAAPTLRDIDSVDDLLAVVPEIPASRTALVARALGHLGAPAPARASA